LLKKKGMARFELLLLIVVAMLIAMVTKSFVQLGLSLVGMNVVRVIRKHRQGHEPVDGLPG
jgi:ABC-type siderophore export system fused ATPase/permease subunit